MKNYVSKKNNSNNKHNKKTIKKSSNRTRKNKVLHGGSSSFLNFIKRNMYLDSLGSGAKYIKNSAMSGLAKGAKYVAESRVGQSVKTKVVSALGSETAFDFYKAILPHIINKPKNASGLLINKIKGDESITLDDIYKFFNVAKIDLGNIVINPALSEANYNSINYEFNSMTNENSLCLQYYKNNSRSRAIKPLMTLHKILLSTYFNLNNLNNYMTQIKDIIDIKFMKEIFTIFDDIINIDSPIFKFTDLFEKIIRTQNITFEDIDFLVLFIIIIINSENKINDDGQITLIKLINYILDVMIEIYYKDTIHRTDFGGDGHDSETYEDIPAFTWLLKYFNPILKMTSFVGILSKEKIFNTDLIINIFNLKFYNTIIPWLIDCKETMDKINRLNPSEERQTGMDLQKYLIVKIRIFIKKYKYINFGFLINLITKTTDVKRKEVHDFLRKLIDAKFSVEESPEDRRQERRRSRTDHNNTTFTKVKINMKLFSNDVNWNNFKEFFTINNPTLFDVINNEDNQYIILPYILSSISIFGDNKRIDIPTSNIIVTNMNTIFGELYGENCNIITTVNPIGNPTVNPGLISPSYKSSTSRGFFNTVKTTLTKTASLASFGSSGFTDICKNLHEIKKITNANINTFDTFLAKLLSSKLVHIKGFNNDKLFISHIRQLFIYYTIKSNIDNYIDNLINYIIEYLTEKTFNYPISNAKIPVMLRKIFEIEALIYIPSPPVYHDDRNNTYIMNLLEQVMEYIDVSDNGNGNGNGNNVEPNVILNPINMHKLLFYVLMYYEILNIWFLIFKANNGNISKTNTTFFEYKYIKDYNKFLLPEHKVDANFIPSFFEFNMLISSPIIENLLEIKIKHIKNSNYILYKDNVQIFPILKITMNELEEEFVNVEYNRDRVRVRESRVNTNNNENENENGFVVV